MNAAPRLALVAICAAALAATAAEKRPFDLYQGIIDCQPFGPPPDDPSVDPSSISRADAMKAAATDEEKAAEKQQEELEKAVSVSVLNIAPDGRVMVGFTDATAKPAANFYLAVGDARGGWTVKEADPVEKSVVLEKDGVEIERTVGNGAGKGTAKAKAAQFARQLCDKAEDCGCMKLIKIAPATSVNADPVLMRNAALALQKELKSTALVAAYESDGKPQLLLMYSDDLVAAGRNAGKDIREAAKFIQGGGGGQPGLATAGGKNVAGLSDALETLVSVATGK